MHRLSLLPALFLSLTALGQPAINPGGVLNSASYMPAGLPGAGIAQGSLFLVFGQGLGPAALEQASYPLPLQLSGTSVKVSVNGTNVDALMVYTLRTQVAAVLPSSTPVGTGTLTVTYNGQTSATAPITVVRSAFGVYTLNQAGSGPAVVTTTSFAPITLAAAAKPGDTLILWGTGLGPVAGNEAAGPLPGELSERDVRLYVGNLQARVTYRGRSGCCSGLDQIAFEVPAGVSGCYVPVSLTVDGVPSNYGSIAVAAQGGVCSDPSGLSSTLLSRATAPGGTLKVGFVELIRINADVNVLGLNLVVNQDQGSAHFYNFTADTLLRSRGISDVSVFGACAVQVCRSTACIPNQDAINVGKLDAGPALSVSGPKGAKSIPRVTPGEYFAEIGGAIPLSGTGQPDYLEPGTYTASGQGGTDVGAFTASATLGTSRVWQNKAAISSVPRSADLTVRWDAGSSQDYVAILGTSVANATPTVSATFICTERASAGTFTVPARVLSSLPASGPLSQGGLSVPGGFLLLGNYNLRNQFTAPGLDLGFFNIAITDGKNVAFQ